MPRKRHPKHQGVTIAPVQVTRYEVRDLMRRKLKTFATLAQAKAWIDGYLARSRQLERREALETADDEPPFDPPYVTKD